MAHGQNVAYGPNVAHFQPITTLKRLLMVYNRGFVVGKHVSAMFSEIEFHSDLNLYQSAPPSIHVWVIKEEFVIL